MEILNYINGEWIKPSVKEYFDVINPATANKGTQIPLCGTKRMSMPRQKPLQRHSHLGDELRSRIASDPCSSSVAYCKQTARRLLVYHGLNVARPLKKRKRKWSG